MAKDEAIPGHHLGRHYTAYVDEVRRLKRARDLAGAEELLGHLVEATETEARAERWGVAPWYDEQLAILHRNQKRLQDELRILERYAAQAHAPGVKPGKLAERLEKVRGKMDKLR